MTYMLEEVMSLSKLDLGSHSNEDNSKSGSNIGWANSDAGAGGTMMRLGYHR